MCSYICHSLLLLLLNVHKINTQQLPFDTLVSFGDSNTDTGNVYNLTHHTWPIVPPYFQGRFSNGPVWIEKLGVSNVKNYAYGGATTDNDLVQGYTASDTKPVPGVRQQILIYLNETNTANMNFARTLYVIWVGGNNYYFNQTISPSTVAASILNGVKDLLHIGVKHLLIVNQSPVEAMPFIRTPEQAVYYRERTTYHNNNLSIGISKLVYNRQEVSLYLFDVYSFVLKIIANDSHYSFNVKDNCWNILNGNVTILCSNPESYVYIDQYHFTTRMHQLIGDAARQFIASWSGISKSSYSISVILCALLFLILSFSS
jgi:phospholipase/lecithinase/hemolysin